jgi:3-polyprenyl-4-hydroxybenzoate decarboxylase
VADPAKPERLVVGISGALGMIYGMRALEMPRPLGIEKVSCTPALTDVSSIARGPSIAIRSTRIVARSQRAELQSSHRGAEATYTKQKIAELHHD